MPKLTKMMFKINFGTLKFSKISAKLYNLLYWMSPDHILKLVGWPQARLASYSIRIYRNSGNLIFVAIPKN